MSQAAQPQDQDPLALLLKQAADAARALDAVVDASRDAIVTLGEQIAKELAQLDPAEIKALGLTVEVVTRTDGVILEDTRVPVRHLPTIDDSSRFERRAGTTALYLDAFHGGFDRELLQIQSTPGVMVSGTSTLEVVKTWLLPVCGIVVESTGEARLVNRQLDVGKYAPTRGANARNIVHTFIEALGHEIARRARFNWAADLPR